MVQIFLCIHKFKRHKLVMTSNPFSIPGLIFGLALRKRMLQNIPNLQEIPDDLLEMIGILKMYRKQLKPLIHSRNRKRFYKSLNKTERRLRSRKIPRCALTLTTESAWVKLLQSKNDQAMITATGLSYEAFQALHSKFKPL